MHLMLMITGYLMMRRDSAYTGVTALLPYHAAPIEVQAPTIFARKIKVFIL